MSVASELAEVDIARASSRPFSLGTRPVIRWIKGDGRDDEVTRSAIAQATRVFGDRVVYFIPGKGASCGSRMDPRRGHGHHRETELVRRMVRRNGSSADFPV